METALAFFCVAVLLSMVLPVALPGEKNGTWRALAFVAGMLWMFA